MHRLQVIPLPPSLIGRPPIEGRIIEPGPFPLFHDGFPPPPPPFPLEEEPFMDWEVVEIVLDVAMFIFFLWLIFYLISLVSYPMGYGYGGGGVYLGNFGGGYGHHFHGGHGGVVAGRPHIHSGGFHTGGHSHASGGHSHSSGGHSHSHGRRKREAGNSWVDEPEALQILSVILDKPQHFKE